MLVETTDSDSFHATGLSLVPLKRQETVIFLMFSGAIEKNQWYEVYYVKSIRVRSYSGPHFSRIFPHSDWIWVQMQENAGKMRNHNNSEYEHFLRSDGLKKHW